MEERWKRIVGGNLLRKLRQTGSVRREELRGVVERIPTQIQYDVPFFLTPTEREATLHSLPERCTSQRARSLLKRIREVADYTFGMITLKYKDLNYSSDEDEDFPPPKRRRKTGSGKKGGRSKRDSNRRRAR